MIIKQEEKRLLARAKRRWDDNIVRDFEQVTVQDENWLFIVLVPRIEINGTRWFLPR